MGNNIDIAFEIYDTLHKKQQEQQKQKILKPEDVEEFSERDFVEDLQKTVNFFSKNIEKASVIDDIYRILLKSVKGISNIDEISTSSGIRIPEKMILESVNIAIKLDENKGLEGDASKIAEMNSNGLLAKDIMENYENLSDENKRKFRFETYERIFGEDIAKTILKQETIQEKMRNSEEYQNATQEDRTEADKVLGLYDSIKDIAQNLGIDPNILDSNKKRLMFIIVIEKLENAQRNEGYDDLNISHLLREIGVENPEQTVQGIKEKIDANPQIITDASKVSQRLSVNRSIMEENMPEIKKFLAENFSQEILEYMSESDIYDCFLMAFDENGKINPLVAQGSIKMVLENIKESGKLAQRFGIYVDESSFGKKIQQGINELNNAMNKTLNQEEQDLDFGIFDMEISEEYLGFSDDMMTDYMNSFSEELMLDPEMLDLIASGSKDFEKVESILYDEPEAESDLADVLGMDCFRKVIKENEISNEDVSKELALVQQVVYSPKEREELEEK